jgi:hypothetical protein
MAVLNRTAKNPTARKPKVHLSTEPPERPMQIDWGTASVAAGVPLIALIGGMYALSQRPE